MKKITSIEELKEEIESDNYNYYGLRKATEHDEEIMERGYLDCSFDWIDGEQTDEELNGTCAVSVNEYCNLEERLEQVKKDYCGTTILLIADKYCEYGNDENEVILGNGCGADIVAIVEI